MLGTTQAWTGINTTYNTNSHYLLSEGRANATTFNSTAAGGSANKMPVTCNGTNWVLGASDNVLAHLIRKYA
jgi:hypothetical protein